MPTWWYRCETVKGAFRGSFHISALNVNQLHDGDRNEGI